MVQGLPGIDQGIASGLGLGAIKVGAAHRIEKCAAFLLKAVQSTASAGTGHADFDRQVEYQGLVWAQRYDKDSFFWPAVQTVYDDDTSILNSMFNMLIAVELEKVAEITWRQLTGISGLTENQFITRSNRLIEEAVKGRFDNRVVIVPDTFVSEADKQRGFSWGCNIVMYGNNMKTVGSFTIVARRREDLEQ